MRSAICAILLVSACGAAHAIEAVSYKYDALGRLTDTNIANGPNGGRNVRLCYDKAGNRLRYASDSTATVPCPDASQPGAPVQPPTGETPPVQPPPDPEPPSR